MVFQKGNKFGGKKKVGVIIKPTKQAKKRFDKLFDDDEEESSDDGKIIAPCGHRVSSPLIDVCYKCVEKKQPGGVFAPPMRYISGTSVKPSPKKDDDK